MDAEAAARGTSTYLVERRIDMLPKPLTEDICSLRYGALNWGGGQGRGTITVLWVLPVRHKRVQA